MEQKTLQDILNRSRDLISSDMDKTLDKIALNERDTINGLMEGGGAALVESQAPQANPTREFDTSRLGPLAAKLPKEIVESFQKNPINANDDLAFLDNMAKPQAPKQPKKQVIREVATPSASAPIDYSMVKMIVEGVVKKEMEGIKESLNLGGNEINAMFNTKGGFRFLTKNGDIYEATLVKKGNINENKKASRK